MPKSYDPKPNKKDIYKKDPGAAITSMQKAMPEYDQYLELKEMTLKKSPDLSQMIQIDTGLPGGLSFFIKADASPEEIEERKQRFINNITGKN